MSINRGEVVDHLAFTLEHALEWYSAGLISWEQMQEELRQESAYLHWLTSDED